jgi:hypothetical protein
MIMLIGDSANIKYTTGLDNPNEIKSSNPTRESLLSKVAMKYKKVVDEVDFTEDKEEEAEEEPKAKGLMSRRS